MAAPGLPSLFDVARSGAPADLIAALPAGASPSSLLDEQGTSLTLHVVFSGRADMLEALLAHARDLSLHDAAAAGDAARVDALLAAGSDALNLLSPDGWTALHLAAHLGHLAICERLIEAGAATSIFSRAFECNLPLHAACAGRQPEVVALLARHTADIDVRVAEGFTALLEAAHQGDVASVRALLAAGADPARKNDAGRTALDLAREAGHDEVVRLLGEGA